MSENNSLPQFIDSRYRLVRHIGSGGMGTIYQVTDLMTGTDVALKRVTTDGSQLLFASRADSATYRIDLAREFRMLASLRHPNIISVLDYGFDAEKKPYYTMDLLKEPETVVGYAADLPKPAKIGVMVQMLQALAYLHRRGIVHRDLKPENVLVEAGTVRVLDFGLAMPARQKASGEVETAGSLSGTLGYMAPEVLTGAEHTERSDLYALGVIGYEIFFGKHPFTLDNAAQLIQDVLYSEIEFPEGVVDADVLAILQRLLSKQAEGRYAFAAEVITAFAEVIDSPQIAETARIRDSYIQAADFVGREHELQQLQVAMLRLMQPGDKVSGSVWLIAGESGVGKSRLMDEVRSRALVEGALTLRGQAIDGGVPYQLWRNVVRRLILAAKMADFDLGVLKEMAADVETLVGRPIPDVPELGERARVQRLIDTLTALFRAQTQPVVLLLEDLHWADDGLEILQRLAAQAAGMPLLILGTYRNEELPELPELVPEAKVIMLKRLTSAEIKDLSVSILGEQIGKQTNVLNLLQRETEGNIFFLVEVVRVLAEEAGKLSNIGAITLPDSVFSGSMQTVIERRLSRLPANALPLLRLAAIYGREVNLELLKALDGYTSQDEWLLQCSQAAILEFAGDGWRFTHDRIRDGILDVLDESERPRLNRMVALAIETAYPGNDSYALRLMRYWSAAGEPDKEAHYARVAAIQSFNVSDYREALALFSRAASITGVDTPAQVFVYQGEVHYRLGNFKAAEASLKMALRRSPTEDEHTHVLSVLGDIAADQGKYIESRNTLTDLLSRARATASQSAVARVLASLGEVYWRMGQISRASDCLYEADSIAQELNDLDRHLQVLNRIAVMALYRGDVNDAADVLEDAYFKAIAADHSERAMAIQDSLGLVSQTQGDLKRAETRFLSAIEFAHKLRLHQQIPPYMAHLAIVRLLNGDALRAQADLREALGRAMASGLDPQVLNVVAGFAMLAHRNHNQDQARLLSGLILSHEACDHALRRDVRERLRDWAISVPEARQAAAGKDFEMAVSLLMI